jgi:hypothetical protein
MDMLLVALHLGSAFLWLGCVLTEALFERSLLAGDRASHQVLADLHVRVDKYIEIPAILGVLATGVWLWAESSYEGLSFFLMITAGLVAIVSNLYCVWIVFRRRDAAHSRNWKDFDRLDHLQHKVGAIVLIGLAIALVSGLLIRW